MQAKATKGTKKRAATPHYISPNQLTLLGFETPFEQKLTTENRWVKMANAIPWDSIVVHYDRLFSSAEGRPPISGRVILGAMIIKHIEALTDRKTIQHIRENMFMQYFLGYTSFTNEAPFSDTLFVEIRKRLTLDLLSKINDVIVLHCLQENEKPEPPPTTGDNNKTPSSTALQGNNDLVKVSETTMQTLPPGNEKTSTTAAGKRCSASHKEQLWKTANRRHGGTAKHHLPDRLKTTERSQGKERRTDRHPLQPFAARPYKAGDLSEDSPKSIFKHGKKETKIKQGHL